MATLLRRFAGFAQGGTKQEVLLQQTGFQLTIEFDTLTLHCH